MYEVNEGKSLESYLKELEEIIRNNKSPEIEKFLEFEKRLNSISNQFLSLIEYTVEAKDFIATQNRNKLSNLLKKLKGEKISVLMDEINNEGRWLRKQLGEAFEKSSYKILELTRAGKRSEVFYNIARIFITNGVEMPPGLKEAFKPHYDLQTFQSLIYSFLVSILSKEEDESNEQ